MAPTLNPGDDIMIDLDDCGERLRDGIYVLRAEDALVVKRLALNPIGRRVTVQSDNPAYPDWPDCSLEGHQLHRPGDLDRPAHRLTFSGVRSIEPDQDGKRDADRGADQNSCHRVLDREPVHEPGEDEDGEEASARLRCPSWHASAHGRRRCRAKGAD